MEYNSYLLTGTYWTTLCPEVDRDCLFFRATIGSEKNNSSSSTEGHKIPVCTSKYLVLCLLFLDKNYPHPDWSETI